MKGLNAENKHHQDHQLNLKTHSSRQRQNGRINEQQHIAYQLCACANGKLFIAEPDSICQADKRVC